MNSPLKKSTAPSRLEIVSMLFLLLVFLLAPGCSSNGNSSSDQSSYTAAVSQSENNMQGSAELDGESGLDAGASLSTGQPKKIVKTAYVSLETLQFQQTIDGLVRSTEEIGGYVQSSQVEGESLSSSQSGNRSASFTLRIPVQELDAFLHSLSELGNVLSQSQESQDITDSYYDTQARLNALQAQESRLLELMNQAENLEQLLQLEEAITQVRYQLESLTASMKRYDNDVAYSTVTVSLWEVEEYQEDVYPHTFGTKIRNAFRRSGESFLNFSEGILSGLIVVLPIVLIYGGLIALAVAGILRLRRKKRGKTPAAVSSSPQDANAEKVSDKENSED